MVLHDLNVQVGYEEVENGVGKYGDLGQNESGLRLLEICMEQELVVKNCSFKEWEKNKVYMRGWREEQ